MELSPTFYTVLQKQNLTSFQTLFYAFLISFSGL